MSLFVNLNEKRPSYYFIDAKCIGRSCFHAVNAGDASGCYNRKIRGVRIRYPNTARSAPRHSRPKAGG